MLRHSSRGIALHLSAASNALYKIKLQVQKAEQKSHGLLIVLLEALLLQAVLHIYALRQRVRSVCRSQQKLRNTTTTYDTTKRTYNLVVVRSSRVRVRVKGSSSSSSSSSSSNSNSSSRRSGTSSIVVLAAAVVVISVVLIAVVVVVLAAAALVVVVVVVAVVAVVVVVVVVVAIAAVVVVPVVLIVVVVFFM